MSYLKKKPLVFDSTASHQIRVWFDRTGSKKLHVGCNCSARRSSKYNNYIKYDSLGVIIDAAEALALYREHLKKVEANSD